MGSVCWACHGPPFLGFGEGNKIPVIKHLLQADTNIITQKADSLDILLVLAGYVLMHTTFIRLFLSSRSLGSNFWLNTAILASSVLSFIVALPIAGYLGIPLEPVSLIEALLFLVCTVGFDKPLCLA